MKTFSPGTFSAHLLKSAVAVAEGAKVGLTVCAKLIQETAKTEIGEYQSAVGPFPAWASLSEATLADKEAKGYAIPNPLLRTGELRDSIQYEVGAFEAIIGSTSPIAAFQEFGTNSTGWGAGIPPRSFIGSAAYRNKDKMIAIFGSILVIGIAGGNVISKDIGYALGYHQDLKP
jgi:phage gpG-like protein